MIKKLLIIDDETNIRILITRFLEEAFEDSISDKTFEIHKAPNGEIGLQIAEKEKPDLILSDVMMPKIDGYEVCRKIKNDLRFKTFFILITAKGQKFDKSKGIEVGCDEYITKPFYPDYIIKKVEEVLDIKSCE